MNADTDEKLDTYRELIKAHAFVALGKMKKPLKCDFNDLFQQGVVVFLQTKKNYSDKREASFRTYLVVCLRQHYSDEVKKSYRNKETNLLCTYHPGKLPAVKHKSCGDPVEAVSITLLLDKFTPDELEYAEVMVSLEGVKRTSRRKVARGILGITTWREKELRNSIESKMKG